MKPRRIALYVLALLLPLAMLWVRQAMPVAFGARPLLILFMFPVIASALLGGLGPGLLATAAVGGLTAWFLVPPVGSFAIAAGHDLAQWAMLLANGVLVSLMSHALFRARRRETAALEEQRRQSEASFQAIFEQAAVGIAQVAESGRFLRVNGKFCAIVGYSQDELLARTFMDITHPDDLPGDLEQVRRLNADEIPSFSREKHFIRKDGAPVWARIHITAVRKPDGTPDYRIGVIEDISEARALEDALRQNQRRLDEASRLAKLGHWHWDLTTDIHAWSEEIYRLYGRDPALPPAVYPEVRQYFTPESWAGLAAAVEQCLADGQPYERDAQVLRPDGSHAWITARGTAVRDAKGFIVALHGTLQDITAHKEAEGKLTAAAAEQLRARRAALNLLEEAQAARARAEATLKSLQESEGRFRALVEQSLAGIYIIQDGLFRYVNPTFVQMFGYAAPEDIVGRVPFPELVAPEDRERVAENVHRRASGEIEEDHYVFKGLRQDGLVIDLEVHGHAFEYQGKPGVIGLILDITKRKAAEEALRARERYIRALFDNFPFMVWLKDRDSRFLAANRTVAKVAHAASPEEMVGKDDRDFWPPEMAEHFRADDRAVLASGQPKTVEEEISEDGRRFWLETFKSPVELDGQVIGTVGFARDITERRVAEAELQARNEELERFNRATVGRELDMLEMKQSINALSRELGREAPYPLAFLKEPGEPE